MHTPEVKLDVPCAPIPFRTRKGGILGYELLLQNMSKQELTLQSLEVTSPEWGYCLAKLEGDSLAENTRYATAEYKKPEQQAWLPGQVAFVYLWLDIEHGMPIPSDLEHEVKIGNREGTQTFSVRGTFPVQERLPLSLQPPLHGEHWVAGNGPANTTGHRRTFLPVRGQPDIAQRFAVDWVQFGAEGTLFHDDPAVNSNWYGYGADLLAVAEGTVLEARDGIPENVPLSEKMAIEITLDSAPGNYVLLDIGDEHYALYAHLLPGSLRVKAGERVKAGDVLGKLGNSGNSDAPHLHFHLGNHASPLGMQGLPYHLERFELVGQVESVDELVEKGLAWQPGTEKPQLRHNESFLSNDVLNL